jgi:hypothetical protein
MRKRVAFLSALVIAPLMLAAASAAAAVDGEEPSTISSAARTDGRPWAVRAEGSLVDMRDNWLGLPGLEVGLTVGRDLTPWFSVELTGSARNADSVHRSWSAMALARGVLVANATGRHALTLAGGPFLEVGHFVHGTLPFAHAELAYVYRSSFGLTFVAGAGPNIALASSSYVEPPPRDCPDSDAVVVCIDFGPDAREIHAGDTTAQIRTAIGWQF